MGPSTPNAPTSPPPCATASRPAHPRRTRSPNGTALISGYFDTTHAMRVCLGRMFADDAGYAEYYDGLAPGLAVWPRGIIFARANGVAPETVTWG